MKKQFLLALLLPGWIIAQTPGANITSWKINTTGHQAQYYDSNGSTVLNLNDSSEVQQVCYNSDSIYVRTNILGSFIMGPWPGDPFLADGQNNSYLFPRNPSYPSPVHANKATGAMGLQVNGVILYDDGDGKSYNSTTNSNSNTGAGVWNQIAWVAHLAEMDAGNGHPDPNNIYHNHHNPVQLCNVVSSTTHSPIIGWSYDGWPIYGPFGYADSMNSSSAIVRMTSSWQLRNITTRTTFYDGTTASQTGPAVSATFPLGTYIEDYEYVANLGELDYYNGRYCVTPEYPSGTYAYFLNTDASGNPSYPNMIGPKYYGTAIMANFGTGAGSASAPTSGVSCYTPTTGCTVTTSTLTNVSCSGLSDGAATVSVSGATGTVTYTWTPSGGSAASATNLAAGTYTVSVSDGASCSATHTVTITEPTAIVVTNSVTNVACNGGTNGAIDVSVSGGQPFGNSSPGLLISEVHANPNSSDGPFEFVEMIATKNIDFGTTPYTVIFTNNGSATANGWVAGLGLSYAFEISTGTATQGQVVYVGGSSMIPTVNVLRSINTNTTAGDGGIGNSNPTASGVLGNGGPSADGVAVFNLGTSSLTSTSVPVDAIFYGVATGSAVVTGGTAGYELPVNDNYSGGKLQSTSFIGPDAVSTQYLRATGTFDLATNTFTTPRTWANTATFTNLASSVSLTNPYTYAWSNASTTEDLSGLVAGTYSVTVTDGAGCTATSTVTITQPAVVSGTTVISDVLCNGAATGMIDLTPAGGAGTYSTYAWSNGATTQDVSGLSAGSYTVTITDANSCTGTVTATINEPATAVTLTLTPTVASCTGGDGTVDLTASGGTGTYTYSWSTGATTEDVSGLNAGTYSVTVTDVNNCAVVGSVTVTSSSGITLGTVSANVACNGGTTGSIDLTVTGGTAAFSYAWSNSSTSEDLSGLAAGNYSVTVTDAANCVATTAVTITEPAALVATGTATNVSCNGNSTGAIDLAVTGGTGSYTYLWDNASTTEDLTSLAAGTYSVTVTDANSCVATATVSVTQPSAALSAAGTGTNILCNGGSTGSVDLTVSGGTSAYTFLWNNAASTEDLSSLSAGTYTVTVTDANNCTTTASITLTEPAAISVTSVNDVPSCNGGTDGSIDVTATGGTGVLTFLWSNTQTTEDVSGLAAGTYTVDVTDANNCTVSNTITLSEPAVLSAATTATDVDCNGADNGSIDLTVSGGTSGFTYAWSNSDVTEDISSLSPGTYSVTITDANGCTATTSATITEPSVIVIGSTVTDEFSGNDGSIDLTVSGGTTGYSFSWSNSATTEDISGLTGGTYTVVVTDANNCTASDTIVVQTTVGMAEVTTNGVSLYPNPASAIVRFSFKQVPERIEIHDAQGKLVTSVTANLNTIDVSGLNNGIYNISFHYKNRIEIKRLIKN